MGSGSSYDDYEEDAKKYEELTSTDDKVKAKASEERKARIGAARAEIASAPAAAPAPAPKRDTSALYDQALVARKITKPEAGVERVHVVLVDNSGSNRQIAQKLRDSSGYLLANLRVIDPTSQIAFVYFSDHCDGAELVMQEVDYVKPDEKGDKALYSSLTTVRPASGGDAPEAIECALHRAAELDVGYAEPHLYLVTDVVGHGMGMSGDDGCPLRRSWSDELKRARQVYKTLSVIGCGTDPKTAELQRQFLDPARGGFDFIDLSSIKQIEYRLGITGNALLFLIARQRDVGSTNNTWQTVELFLSMLYEKWLSEPLFGANTDLRAREAVERFFKYIDAPREALDALHGRVLPD